MSARDEAYAERVRERRREKDEFFADHPGSPIPTAGRESFEGLRYFDPDPAYRVEVPLHEHDDPRRYPSRRPTRASGAT